MTEYDIRELAGLTIIIGVFMLLFLAGLGVIDDVLTDFRFQLMFGLAGSLLVGGGVWELFDKISISATGSDSDNGEDE